MSKIRNIVKAFTEPLPEGQDWYEKRLKICESCPRNTKNMTDDQLSIVDKTKIGLGLCDNGNHCTACGCCIERKAALKISECGIGENPDIDEEPKWLALEIPSAVDKRISIVNLTPEMGSTYTETTEFVYDLGLVTTPKVSFDFQLKREGGLEVKTYSVGCSCTVGAMKGVDKNTTEFNMSISTIGFREGVTSKKMKIIYFEKPNVTKEIHVTFKIKTDGKK